MHQSPNEKLEKEARRRAARRSIWIWSITAALGVIILWFISLYALVDMPERGTFGDMFGAVNALFSGLAFAGVIIAIMLQSQELKAQREELEVTREQIEGQKDALLAQNKTLLQQRFENTFFQMLSLHNDIVNSMDMRRRSSAEIISEGRSVFRTIGKKIEEEIRRSETQNTSSINLVLDAYEKIYKAQQAHLGHYFRNLYRILKFIHESNVENKKFYTDIVRAQLSNQELQLLFYNCLSHFGCEKFKPLVEEYALLNNLPPEIIYEPQTLLSQYKPEAYGGKIPFIPTSNSRAA